MKTVKELYERLKHQTDFKLKYPQYDLHDGKIHVLYLSPCMNETGYYRMILPSLELNLTQSHSAILGHIHPWDFSKLFDDYDSPVDLRLVQWADYVVLPALFTDVSYIIESIRELNDDVEFVMDVDMNYHELPVHHPGYKKLSTTMKEQFIKNLGLVDVLTAPGSDLLNYYQQHIHNREEEFMLYFERYPNLLSNFTLEEMPDSIRNPSDTVRIGIILDSSQYQDFALIEKALLQLQVAFGLKIEIILYGWSSKNISKYPFIKTDRLKFVSPVPFYDYHRHLNRLALDIGLIPSGAQAFQDGGQSYLRYLDFSACMVPVVASRLQPLEKMVRDGETAFLADSMEEWFTQIKRLIEDKTMRQEMGQKAFKRVWEHYSYTPKNLERLTNLFI